MIKKCSSCKEEKPIEAFDWRAGKKKNRWRRSECRECRKVEHRRLFRKIRLEVLSHYSGGAITCACCGEAQIEFLAIDHIEGGGSRERRSGRSSQDLVRALRRDNFPPGYRVLCMNCNHSLGIHGYCPHARLHGDDQ